MWVKANEVNYLAVSVVARSSEIREKIRICRKCQDYVIGREITTELKITVDNAILKLCEAL